MKLTVKRWKGWLAVLSPLERYSSCRSYRWCCLGLSLHRRTDNFDCKHACRWFPVGFAANSIARILLKHRQSVFPIFVGFVSSVIVVFCCCLFTSSVLKLTAFAFAVPLPALNLKSTFSVLRSFVCNSFPARISSHLLNPLLLSLLFSFICLRYWVVIHRP